VHTEIRRRVFRDEKEVWIVDPNTKWLYGGVKELQVNYSTRYHLKFRKPTFGGTSADDFDYSLRARGRRGGSELFAQVGGDGGGWKSFNTNYRQFQRGFDAGFLGGIKSTGNFFLSLRTEQGWKDVGMGIYNTAMISCQACPQGIPLRLDLENAIINYVDNIPNMSWYEMGYDAGFGVEKVLEFGLTRNVSTGVGFGMGGLRVLSNTTLRGTTLFKTGKNFRIDLDFKNGLHYHRRGPGGIGRHRPWQVKPGDEGNFWKRF